MKLLKHTGNRRRDIPSARLQGTWDEMQAEYVWARRIIRLKSLDKCWYGTVYRKLNDESYCINYREYTLEQTKDACCRDESKQVRISGSVLHVEHSELVVRSSYMTAVYRT